MSVLTEESINKNLRQMEFPWVSPVISRGNEIEKELKLGKKFPFNEVIHAHAGDPQGMGQKPITFFQQVVSLCMNPNLIQADCFPSDVKQRAIEILENCRGYTIGSFSDCRGMAIIRKQVATFIEKRDGYPASVEDIFLSSGATEALRVVLYLFSGTTLEKPPGVMISVPQYPLFSSTIAEYEMFQINYYLDEDNEWALSVDELRRAINASRPFCIPKVLIVINPGNPSGFVLSEKDIEGIIRFAYEENLFILADEVYQYNIYDPNLKFCSFKKVLSKMGPPYSRMELASFMSGSKGYMGECGSRSGYCEIINLDSEVKKTLIKLLSGRLCPTLLGQIIMYCITKSPLPREPSYKLFQQEKTSILESLRERAEYCYRKFNSISGLSCNKVVGAMYVYPRVHISQKAIKEAESKNLRPDEFYTMELLQTVGVCVIPGCLFGQIPGTYHFRLTFLPQMDKLRVIVERILRFHQKFMDEYGF